MTDLEIQHHFPLGRHTARYESPRMKLFATTPDPNEARRYYEDMAQGRLTDVSMEGFGRVGRVVKRRGYTVLSKGRAKQPIVKLVTPTAMATEQARARLSKIKKRKPKTKQRQPITKKRSGRSKKKATRAGERKKTFQSASRRRSDNFSK